VHYETTNIYSNSIFYYTFISPIPIPAIHWSRNSLGDPQEFITLKVFDILGTEIATLVNEEKPAGEYHVEFSANGGSTSGGNAYDLPSGIYFYQLKAGKFVETKKMILLR